jgi:hypothetical protein
MEMEWIKQIDERTQRWHDEDVAWKKDVENRIQARHHTSIWFQLLIAVIGGIVVLIGAKVIPFYGASQAENKQLQEREK